MDEEGQNVDRLENLLQAYADDLTRLAQALADPSSQVDLDVLAAGLGSKKTEMVTTVQGLSCLDATAEVLLEDLKSWEGLTKQAAQRNTAADKAVKQAEGAIRQAIEELRRGDNEHS